MLFEDKYQKKQPKTPKMAALAGIAKTFVFMYVCMNKIKNNQIY